MIKESIEAWLYSPKEGQILLLQVQEDGLSFWQPITGGIERGESPAQACRREIFEETGLQFTLSDLFPVGHSTVKIDEDLTIQKSLFLVRTEKKEIRLSDEHVDFQWLPLNQVSSQLYWPSNQATFETIREVL